MTSSRYRFIDQPSYTLLRPPDSKSTTARLKLSSHTTACLGHLGIPYQITLYIFSSTMTSTHTHIYILYTYIKIHIHVDTTIHFIHLLAFQNFQRCKTPAFFRIAIIAHFSEIQRAFCARIFGASSGAKERG